MNTFKKYLLNFKNKKFGECWGTRHSMAIVGFWGFSASYAMRFNLSIAIVSMVNHTRNDDYMDMNNTNITKIERESCLHLKNSKRESAFLSEEDGLEIKKISEKTGEFFWNEATQGIILSSFFWGYFLTQLPGGILSNKYGCKKTLGSGMFLTAIMTILLPICAKTNIYLLMANRFVQGLGEGVTTPAMHDMLGTWSPINERSILNSFVYSGSQFGTALTLVLSGYLIHSGFLGGWPSIFYVIGILSIIWCAFWAYYVYDEPSIHPRITEKELNFIQNSLGSSSQKDKLSTPWKKIFTSVPFYALCIGHMGQAYGLYVLLSFTPTYMKTVLHFDIKQNSWASATPYFSFWIISILFSILSDYLISKKIVTTIFVRKSAQFIGHIFAAIFLMGASYAECKRSLTVGLFTAAIGINGAVYAGYSSNHADLSPNHAGILMGITNTLANIIGFVSPSITGAIINQNPTILQWRKAFYITAAIYLINFVFYFFFAEGTEQPWNREKIVPNSIVKIQRNDSIYINNNYKVNEKIPQNKITPQELLKIKFEKFEKF